MTTFGTAGALRAIPPNAGHLGQGLSYPPQYDAAGRLQLSWGRQLVAEAVQSIVETLPGERPMEPDYGGSSATFEPIGDLDRARYQISRCIEEHEPRIAEATINFVSVSTGDPTEKLQPDIEFTTTTEADSQTLTAGYFAGPAST